MFKENVAQLAYKCVGDQEICSSNSLRLLYKKNHMN